MKTIIQTYPTVPNTFVNTVIAGDCAARLKEIPANSIDFILTDPPYLATYKPRDGRSVMNDDNASWLFPAFAEMYRVLRPNSLCFTFYGWPHADRFVSAFRAGGFRPVSHVVFVKRYASYVGFTEAQHEVAYLLAKGSPEKPARAIPDVRPWHYTGNKLHPTEKPVPVLTPLIEAFSPVGGMVLDPFCGSGSSLVAAKLRNRKYIGIEIDPIHAALASNRVKSTIVAPPRC